MFKWLKKNLLSELATGDSITARPNKIVAGQEPTKTNELLQSIGKALDGKVKKSFYNLSSFNFIRWN